MNTKTVVISQTQLKVLLKGTGSSVAKGIPINSHRVSDQEAINCLNDLMKEKIIFTDDDAFVMNDYMHRIISGINEGYAAALKSRNITLPDLCLFINKGDDIVVCNVSKVCNDSIKLCILGKHQLLPYCCEEGYLPKDEEDYPVDDNCLERFEEDYSLAEYEAAPLEWNSKIVFQLVPEPDSNAKLSISVIEYSLYRYIRLCVNGKVSRSIYTYNNLCEMCDVFFKEINLWL